MAEERTGTSGYLHMSTSGCLHTMHEEKKRGEEPKENDGSRGEEENAISYGTRQPDQISG